MILEPVLSYEGKVACQMKQRDSLVGIRLLNSFKISKKILLYLNIFKQLR